MKRSTAVITAAAAALVVATAVAVPTFAHGPGGGGGYGGWGMGGSGHGPGMMGPGYGGRHGPGYGGHHGPGGGMGGYGHGPGMMGYGPGGPGGAGAPCADPAAADARLKVVEERLNLTDTQKPAFEAFTKAMRESVESMHEKRQAMDPETLRGLNREDRFAYRENFRADRLEAMNEVREARDQLLAVLDDKQKSTARALLPGRFSRF